MPSTRNLFLVRGFVRLRADEVLSPRGKVPKGRRGRPKGACLMAAPGPPVAKLQCTASLAGARPAGFTSVPGRATVAFKVGRVAKHANKKDEVRNHKGVSKPRLFA